MESHLHLLLAETGLRHHQNLMAHLLITMRALQTSMGRRRMIETGPNMDRTLMDIPQSTTVMALMMVQTLINVQNLTDRLNLTDALQSNMAIDLTMDLRNLTSLLDITTVHMMDQISMNLPITRTISMDHPDMKRVPWMVHQILIPRSHLLTMEIITVLQEDLMAVSKEHSSQVLTTGRLLTEAHSTHFESSNSLRSVSSSPS
jgi:hypothetical protein